MWWYVADCENQLMCSFTWTWTPVVDMVMVSVRKHKEMLCTLLETLLSKVQRSSNFSWLSYTQGLKIFLQQFTSSGSTDCLMMVFFYKTVL